MIRSLIALEGETLYDLAIRSYGDIRGLSDLLRLNPTLDYKLFTQSADLDGNDYIQIEFSPDTGKTIDLTNVSFVASTNISSSLFTVNNFQLVYSKDLINWTSIVDSDISIGSVAYSENVTINVLDSETLYLRWYPYQANHDPGSQFFLADANVILTGSVNGGAAANFLEWDLLLLSGNNVWIGTDTDVNLYSKGTGVLDLTTGKWRGFPIAEVGDDSGFQGQTILYDDSLTFPTIQNDVFIPKREFLDDYLVYDNQSIYDLAIQLYGDLGQGLKEILPLIEAIENGSVPRGTLLARKVPLNNIGEQFNDNDVLVATSPLIIDDDTIIALEEGLEFALVG